MARAINFLTDPGFTGNQHRLTDGGNHLGIPFIQIDEDTYESHIIETKPPTYTADEYKKYMINKKYENNYLSQYRAAEKIIKIKKKR